VPGFPVSRCLALFLTLALPLCASAFQERTINLRGVSITATRSATHACGIDLVIRVGDADQHFVKIDYTYSGTFDRPYSGAPSSGLNLMRDSRTRIVNISVGKATYAGPITRVAGDSMGLVCDYAWDYHVVASETNISEQQRKHEDGLTQKDQARIDEINRRRAEEEERKRRARQLEVDRKAAQARAASDELVDYKRSSPENARCIIRERADIARCEQAKAREREERQKLEAHALQVQRQLEADRRAAERRAAQQREYEARSELARTNPCAAAEDQARRMPQILQQYAAPTPQNAQAKAQWQQHQAALEASCAASKGRAQQSAPPRAPATQPQALQTPEQKKAQAILDLARQLGLVK
jgi:hypothetical protein